MNTAVKLYRALGLERSVAEVVAQLRRVQDRFPSDLELVQLADQARKGLVQIYPLRGGSVFVTQEWEDGVVHILAAAGEMEECLRFSEILGRYHAERGYREMTAQGRRGWERVLRKRGWTTRKTAKGRTILVKTLFADIRRDAASPEGLAA
jgi:hypothetical protein